MSDTGPEVVGAAACPGRKRSSLLGASLAKPSRPEGNAGHLDIKNFCDAGPPGDITVVTYAHHHR